MKAERSPRETGAGGLASDDVVVVTMTLEELARLSNSLAILDAEAYDDLVEVWDQAGVTWCPNGEHLFWTPAEALKCALKGCA